MPLLTLPYIGAGTATYGFAAGTLFFLAWGFIGQSGELRKSRLRLARSSALLFAASLAAAVAMYHLVLLPSTMEIVGPGFVRPYQWLSTALAMAVPVSLYASAMLLIRALYREPGARRGAFLISFGCLLATLVMYVGDYQLIHRVQVPAFDRYAMIESRNWKTRVGEQAPDITLTMLDGTTKKLSDFRGQLVLLNFFATWCGPCNAELPHLQALWNDLQADGGFQMLVVDREESQETVEKFLSDREFTFPVALDPEAAAYKHFADKNIPRTYLIGRDGRILFQTLGFNEELPVFRREWATLQRTINSELALAR